MSQSDYLKNLIKDLMPVEIFDYYDIPRFYSCHDKVGQIFLVYWIDETDNYDSWLYLRVSQERYSSLKSGNISVSKVLSEPEEGFAFVINNYGTDFSVKEISTANIESEWIPSGDYYLNLDDSALPPKTLPEKTLSAVEVAKRSARQVIDLAFVRPTNVYEIGCGKLGKLLDSFQNVIYALSCGKQFDGRNVSAGIKFDNEILVTGVYASSFGVRLQSKGGNIFPEDETTNAIKMLAHLLSSLRESETLPEELHLFNVLARSRFKHLLDVLVESEVSIKYDWGSPSGETSQSQISFNEIKQSLQKIKESDSPTTRTVERLSCLVAVDIDSDFFALKIENNEIIKGKLSKSVSARQFDVPCQINAKLEESCVIDPITDKEKWSYVLVDFKKL